MFGSSAPADVATLPNMDTHVLTERAIRGLRVRGNYFNQRSLALRQAVHSCKREMLDATGVYSPPVVDFELEDGSSGSIVVSDADVPLLISEDPAVGNGHLVSILEAREGDPAAARALAFSMPGVHAAELPLSPAETDFVVSSSSSDTHSEQDISQKGFILLKLSQLGYPVPDFAVVKSRAYADRRRLDEHVAEAIRQLELLTLQRLGASVTPLVFAIRCATAYYIPGLMDTYLNVGVTDGNLSSLERMYGRVGARRMFLNTLRNICHCLGSNDPAVVLNAVRSEWTADELSQQIDRLYEIIRRTHPALVEDPLAQAIFFAGQAYRHFEENQELVLTLCRGAEHHPSLILQKMVCTVRHQCSYAGVISSRHTQTGIGIELQTAHNIFGEEMMTGSAEIENTAFEDSEAIKDRFPAVYHFVPQLAELEREFESPVTIEFAVEATARHQLFGLLQLNQTGMAGRAAITSVVDLHKAGAISRQRVTDLIRPYHIKQLTSDTIDQEDFGILRSFCSGVSVLPRSAVSGRVYFSGDAALRAKSAGEKVCLCKKTFVPTDSVVMREMDAIISLTSAAVHVVTICQSLGIPAMLSLEKNGVCLGEGRLTNSEGQEIREGDWVTISSRRRAIYEGQAKFTPARLLRYMRDEEVELDGDERRVFASLAYAYRYYQQLTRGLEVDQISTLSEVTRLVNFDLREETEGARQLVNSWFDDREALYTQEILKSDIGDHLGQSNVFEMLTLDRKIRFFRRALAKCSAERISGYEAGAFMLGRFLCFRYPTSFWKCFTPPEIALLVNEWVLFEKYMKVLHNVGERRVLLARKQILKEGLDQLSLHPGNVQPLMTLKLSGVSLRLAKDSLPPWTDPQAAKVLELLQQPYRAFYDFAVPWSVRQLQRICEEENLPLPRPEDC